MTKERGGDKGARESDETVVFDEDFNGPIQKRACTDVLFLLILVAVWAVMTAIGLAAVGVYEMPYIKKGDPYRLLEGLDYQGHLCGVDTQVKDLPNLWVPSPLGLVPSSTGFYAPSDFGICVESCPASGEARSDPYGNYGYWQSAVDTHNILGYCKSVDLKKLDTLAGNMLGDFIRAMNVISIAGFLLAAVASLLFISTMRIPYILRIVVWSCIGLVFLLLAAGGYVFITRAKEEEQQQRSSGGTGSITRSTVEIGLLKGVGGALAALAVLWMCIICLMRERIALAVSLIRESARALIAMPFLCLFPILYAGCFVAFTVVWAVFFFYLVSSGEVRTYELSGGIGTYKKIVYDDKAQDAIIFMLFCWFWTIAFLEAFGQLVSSHAVLRWYFSEDQRSVGSRQVLRSAGVITRYHLGTAAFGSLTIAIIRTARVVLEYIKVKLQPQTNCLMKYMLCMLSCCLWCFEKCIKFLNKHAYIQCALFGTGFCRSARRAFGLIFRNLGRMVAVAMVGDFVVLVGKLSISLTCAGAAYTYMSMFMSDQLDGLVLPTVLVAFLSFFTATIFLSTVSTTADTLLQAYIADEEAKRNTPISQLEEGGGGGGGGMQEEEEDGDDGTAYAQTQSVHSQTPTLQQQQQQKRRLLSIRHSCGNMDEVVRAAREQAMKYTPAGDDDTYSDDNDRRATEDLFSGRNPMEGVQKTAVCTVPLQGTAPSSSDYSRPRMALDKGGVISLVGAHNSHNVINNISKNNGSRSSGAVVKAVGSMSGAQSSSPSSSSLHSYDRPNSDYQQHHPHGIPHPPHHPSNLPPRRPSASRQFAGGATYSSENDNNRTTINYNCDNSGASSSGPLPPLPPPHLFPLHNNMVATTTTNTTTVTKPKRTCALDQMFTDK